MKCAKCHQDNSESAQFCGHCGAKLEEYETTGEIHSEQSSEPSLEKKEAAFPSAFPIYDEADSGSALGNNQPWRQSDFVVVVLVSLFMPLIGIILGALKLKYPAMRKQAGLLLFVGLLSLLFQYAVMIKYSS